MSKSCSLAAAAKVDVLEKKSFEIFFYGMDKKFSQSLEYVRTFRYSCFITIIQFTQLRWWQFFLIKLIYHLKDGCWHQRVTPTTAEKYTNPIRKGCVSVASSGMLSTTCALFFLYAFAKPQNNLSPRSFFFEKFFAPRIRQHAKPDRLVFHRKQKKKGSTRDCYKSSPLRVINILYGGDKSFKRAREISVLRLD